ncbi:MAG TPA: hypothetical protein VER14_00670 [Phototrophicaceae bacterium]|nr:hypothetical protein [Phototrophicaceae bacterium]
MLKSPFLDVIVSLHMRYYIKCKLNPKDRQRLRDSLKNGSMGSGTVFREGMQTALREGTIDDEGVVHFIEVCYCLEYGLYPMAMEIPELGKYFGDVVEVKDARLRNHCTMECGFCDCTRNVRLPGRSLVEELGMDTEAEPDRDTFVDIGRIRLNRKKQGKGIQGLRDVMDKLKDGNNVKPIFAAAAISGLFAIFYDCKDGDYLRIKNIPDTAEAKELLKSIGWDVRYGDVESVKAAAAKSSLAKGCKWSNVV